MATFITSKAIGETININTETSTGYWKYNHDGSDSSAFANGSQEITITNINGEFTIISCDSEGVVSGDITILHLSSNLLTSFDGTGLSSLTQLQLENNQLTSFDGTGLSSLTALGLSGNLLTSFSGTGLSSLTDLSLQDNLLTSLDVSPLVNLHYLRLYTMGEKGDPTLTNPITPSSNNQILFDLSQHSINAGQFISTGGRTSASNADFDNLANNLSWSLSGLDLITPPPTGSGKLRVKGVTTAAPTTTTTTTEAPTTTTTTTTSGVPQFNPTESLYVNSLVNSFVNQGKGYKYMFEMMVNSTEIQDFYDSHGNTDTAIGVLHTYPAGNGDDFYNIIVPGSSDFGPIANPLNVNDSSNLASGTYELKLVHRNYATGQIIDVLDTFTMVI